MSHGAFRFWIIVFLAVAGLILLIGFAPAFAQDGAIGATIPPDQTPVYLPLISAAPPTPTPQPRRFDSVPVEGGGFDGPAETSPDLNLSIRSYTPTTAYLGLVNYGGDTDPNAPQIAGMFQTPRLPPFIAAHRVYDWNWNCNPPTGCRGNPIDTYAVTLLEMKAPIGEGIAMPSRGPKIRDQFIGMVLYAEPNRITFVYLSADTPAQGYLVHVEDVAIAPELVALYRKLNSEGRKRLPALRNGEVFGVVDKGMIKIAMRDTGSFLDPRACKDWWMDYMDQCKVQLQRPAQP